MTCIFIKLAIGIDENGQSYRNIDYEMKTPNTREQKLGCNCTRIDSGIEEFDLLRGINEIFRHIR